MESKKINQLATNVSPQTSDLTIIGDPTTGVSKKITLLQIANLFSTIGTVTSVGVTETGDALTITGSPITSAGTINIGFAGDATQYVRGDGALADFPTSTGGGSSVSYYLNSSVSQGTIGGVAYRELSKDPISGAGTDITISADGYVASYITDANDPALLEVPGGNFNCEFYFSVNSNAHNPYVYAELYKYDGTTFTLLGSSQSVPEYLSNGTTLSPYYFAIPVATAALTITDRLAVRIYVNVDTRVVTLHTENNHLCQVVTTFSKGLISLNNLTRQNQFFGTGTSGTDFAISSSVATHTFNLPVASAANTGKLSSSDWSVFNAKQAALTFTAPLVNTSNTISIPAATSSVDGYLDNLDWTNFNTAYNNMIVSAAVTGTTTKTLTLTQQDAGTITASWTDDNTDAVSSVFGRTGAVVATEGDYSLTQLSDVTITSPSSGQVLKYNGTAWINDTDANTGTVTSVAMTVPTGLSVSGSPITSSGTLAVSLASGYSIPTTAKQTEWDTAYTNRITSASFPLSISSNDISISLASASTAGYLSIADWNIFNGKQNALTNPVTGTGNSGYVSIFTGTSAIGNSIIFQSTTRIGILTATPSTTLDVNGGGNFAGSLTALSLIKSGGTSSQFLKADGSVDSNAYITATSISASSPLFYNSGTGVFTISAATGSTNGYLSSADWLTFSAKQGAITLTTTGTSGAATLVGTTLNIPNYATGVGGSGTTNYLPKFTGASTIGNSAITDDGTTVTLISRILQVGSYLNLYSGAYSVQSIPSIRASSSNNMIINAKGSGTLYFNYEDGTGGFYFGNGASGQAAFITSAGAATFSSSIAATSLLLNGGSLIGNFTINGGTGDTTTQNAIQTFTRTSSTGNVLAGKIVLVASDTNWGNLVLRVKSTASSAESDTYYTNALTLAGTTGAATFSSSVTTGGGLSVAGNIATTNGAGTTYNQFANSGNDVIWENRQNGNIIIRSDSSTERMRITSGNVLIGTTTDGGYKLDVNGTLRATGAATFSQKIQISAGGLRIGTSATENDRLIVVNGTDLTTGSTQYLEVIAPLYTGNITNLYGRLQYATCNSGTITNAYMMYVGSFVGTATYSNKWSIYQESTTEKNYFGGTVLIGTTTDNGAKLQVSGTATFSNNVVIGDTAAIGNAPLGVKSTSAVQQPISSWNTATSGTIYFMEFGSGATYVARGSITYNGTITAYNTTSDYRLKEDLKEYNGLEIISKLKTYDYKWKESGVRDYGMMAHELQEVLPNYVTGEKDAQQMQGVDYSKIVPILVKSIQELEARIKQLENK